MKLSDLGLTSMGGYNFTEVFMGTYIGIYKPTQTLNVTVVPSGTFFVKATVL